MLFKTIEEVKAHAGGQINQGVSLANLTAPYQQARDNHLQRYFGDEFLDKLETLNAAGASPVPTATEAKAIQKVGAALALLSIYEWTFTSSVEHSNAGLTRTEGDTVKGAWKYQLTEYRAWSLKSGLNLMDNALRFCDANADDLSLWKDGEGAAYHREVLIRSAQQLRRVHNLPGDRQAYETLRPLMYDLQEFVFVELLGREQLDRLLLSINSPSGVPATKLLEEQLVKMLQRSLASFAVYEGLQRNVVQIEGGRIIQKEALEPQSTEKTSNPTMATINVVALQSQEFAERHLSAIRDFLTANKASLPLYEAWLDTNQPDPDICYPTDPNRPTGRKVVRL